MPALATPPPLRLLSPLPPPQSDPPPQSTVRPTTPAVLPEGILSVSDTAQIYDLLTKMDGKLDGMRDELASVDKGQAILESWKVRHDTEVTPDVERRLRTLEGDRARMIAIAGAIGALAGWLGPRLFGH